MKNTTRNLALAGAALLLAATATGATMAATTSTTTTEGAATAAPAAKTKPAMAKNGMMMGGMLQKQELSDEMKALLEQMKTARESGDTAKAESLLEQMKTLREQELAAKEAALDAAIAGGYTTWKAYATEQGYPTELMEKITAENFASYARLHALKKEARQIEEQLGLQGPGMMGKPGMMMKMDGGEKGERRGGERGERGNRTAPTGDQAQ